MKYVILACLLVLVAPAVADSIPDWVRTNAGWWSEGAISDGEFVQAIKYLMQEGVIVVEHDGTTTASGEPIPDWVRTNAGWWSEGAISDGEFVQAIKYLIQAGVIEIDQDQYAAQLQQELAECSRFTRAYERLDCEGEVEQKITRYQYETTADPYMVGPVTYYYPGADLEMTSGGQPLLTIRMLAVNEGDQNVTLSCTGPAICNYDVTDGSTAYKYASTDFTSGSITIRSGDSREFEMLFGPNIGYGGTTFVCEPGKQYSFRISESFGSATIPLDIQC